MWHSIYWAELTAPDGGIDLRVNGMPVVRLGFLNGATRPLNEFLRNGANRLTLHAGAGVRPQVGEDGQPVFRPVRVTIDRVFFDDADESRRERLLDREFQPRPSPDRLLLDDRFEASTVSPLPVPEGFQPIGPDEARRIAAALDQAARWWRAGDSDSLLRWIDDYVEDYCAAYALQERDDYEATFREMVAAFVRPGTRVDWDPATLRLEPCGDPRFVECRAADGRAALEIVPPGDEPFAFSTIVGIRDGEVRVVR